MSTRIGKYYKISEDGKTLKRLKKFCPRCGPGTFMAQMYDRIVCGHCGFTEFKKKPVKKPKIEPKKASKKPTAKPAAKPTVKPATKPTAKPTVKPATKSTAKTKSKKK